MLEIVSHGTYCEEMKRLSHPYGKKVYLSIATENKAAEDYWNMPYGFHGQPLKYYANPNEHEKAIKDHIERDTRDKTRLCVEKWALVVGFFGLMGLVYTLRETIEATRAAIQQARIAQQQLTLSERPWISVDVRAVKPLVFSTSGAETDIQFMLRNLGHSPAKYVDFHFAALSIFGNIEEARSEQQRICDHMRELSNSADIRDTILPGEKLMQGRAFRITKSEVDEKTYRFPMRSTILLAVVGCVDYQFTFAEGHHQTGFVFLVLQSNGSGIDPTVDTLPMEQVGFSQVGGVRVD